MSSRHRQIKPRSCKALEISPAFLIRPVCDVEFETDDDEPNTISCSPKAVSFNGHGKMSVAVRACACNERGSACNARAMRMDPVHVRGICGFLYLSL